MRAAVTLLLALVALVGACRDTAPAGPTDRAWTTADFTRLGAQPGCRALPAFGSPAFARLSDPGVIEAIAPATAGPSERLGPLVEYHQALAAVLKRYASCPDPAAYLTVAAAMLELSAVELPLADAFIAGFSPDDPTYQTRLGGLAKMRAGTVQLALGVAQTLGSVHVPTAAPGVGRRLGVALARLRPLLAGQGLDAAISSLDAPPDGDDDAHRRALRAELRDALHAPPP